MSQLSNTTESSTTAPECTRTWRPKTEPRAIPPDKIDPPATIADGLRSQIPGELTFPIVQKNVEKIVLVSEDEIRTALKFLLTRMKILTEPSGAASAAAVLAKKLPPEVQRIGVILSGGNVDYEVLANL